jgi:hypothetical protein
VTVVVETAGFEALDRRLQQMPAATAGQMRRALSVSLFEIEAEAKSLVRVDRGPLRRSIHSSITATGGILTGLVGPSVAYGANVEFGRKAGTYPPLEPLIGWVRRHGLTAGGRGRANREVGVARAIQRKIFRRGIAPAPFLVPAFVRALPGIRARFAAIGVRIVAELAR